MPRPETAIIRDFSDADTRAVIDLARELQAHEIMVFDRMKPADTIGGWYVDKLRADVAEHGGAIVVADCAGELAGYATFLASVSSADEADEILYTYSLIGDLAVAERFRRLGIGSLLMAECERRAVAAGQKWLRLNVLAGNEKARRFYACHGMGELLMTLEKPLA